MIAMGFPVSIEDVLHGEAVEWQRLELKEGWNPKAALHTLCAFANDFHNMDGGYLVIGVAEENGCPLLPPHGLPAREIENIQQQLRSLGHKIVPEYHPLVEPCIVEGRHVLLVRAAGGQNRPYQVPKILGEKGERDGEYAFFIRRHASTVEVKRNSSDWMELMELTAKVPFDDRTNQRASIDDLEIELISEHLKTAGSALFSQLKTLPFIELLQKMRLVDGPPEFLRPRNAGLMFFNSHPEEFFPGSQINILVFPDGVAGKRIIRKPFTGPIGQQLTEALEYLKTQILEEIIVKERGRAQANKAWNYPYEAIEEILPNAVYHRSYEEHEPIEVRVEPERLTITSYPGPDRSIKISDMKKGKLIARRYRNRRVGDLLRQIHLAEEAGTGIPTAIAEMRDNGSPPPRFQTDEERTFFTAILPIHPAFLKANQRNDRGGNNRKIPPRITPLQPREERILDFCLTPHSRAEIQALFGLRDARSFRERYLAPLIERELLRLTDPANPSARSQKYQTTQSGEQLIRKLSLFDDLDELDDDFL